MSLEIRAALRGDLKAFMAAEQQAVGRAIRGGVRTATADLQTRMREQVRTRLGRSPHRRGAGRSKAANAIRKREFDDGPFKVAGIVYSRLGRKERGQFIDYLLIQSVGAEIRPRNSKWLYIPNERTKTGRVTKRARTSRRIVRADKNLFFVTVRPGVALLIRKKRANKRAGTGKQSEIVAVLLRRATIRPRLNFKRLVAAAQRDFPRKVLDAFPR